MVVAKHHTFTTYAGGAQRGSHAGAVRDACNRSYRIGLLEHCGTGNLGDDATVEAALQQLTRRWPHTSIVGLSLNPPDTEQRLGIKSFPIRHTVIDIEKQWSGSEQAQPRQSPLRSRLKRFLRKHRFAHSLARLALIWVVHNPKWFCKEIAFLAKSLPVARSLDLLIICGGGQLLDSWGGPWNFPYTLLKWVVLAKSRGAKCYFVNVGAGPIEHPLSRLMLKIALHQADYVSFRDNESRALIEKLGLKDGAAVVTDTVYALTNSCLGARTRTAPTESGLLSVGISPMPYCDPRRYWRKNQNIYDHYITELANFCLRLLHRNYRLHLFSSDIWYDSQAITDLQIKIQRASPEYAANLLVREAIKNIDDYMRQLSRVDYLVTCKFHGVIFAHLLNVPVLALSYHSKITTLMNELQLSKYCVDIDSAKAVDLINVFDSLRSDNPLIKARMLQGAIARRRAIIAQFDQLFPLAPREKRSTTRAHFGGDTR